MGDNVCNFRQKKYKEFDSEERYFDLLDEIEGIEFEIETYRKQIKNFPNEEYLEILESLEEEKEELLTELDTYF